jgi:DNA polymerase III delta prime subunit|tara:strand:- start:11 stop:949 length:939 start_codon:yes stop_codon:yes gene_type:complete
MREEYLWVEKYRPKTVDDCILPNDLKQTFQTFVDQENVPNLLLSGGPGVGKTSVAKAMLEQLDCDYITINGSLSGNIDTLRNDIMQFASSVSFSGGRKYVILDEADYLNPQSTQPALRNFMEEFSKNCGFILTCNFKNRIIEPLHSRCSVIDFKIPTNQKPKIAAGFFKRTCNILEENNIQYDQKVVAELVQKHFPDWRRVLNELQRYSVSGNIDSGLLTNLTDESFKALVSYLKTKNFTEMRKWVGLNSDNESTSLFRSIYENCSTYVEPNSIPQVVLILADYQYKSAFVADQEINLVACLTEMMAEIKWK